MQNSQNPFISCLPDLKERSEVVSSFTTIPLLEKEGNFEYKSLQAERIVSEFMCGLPRHYYFIEMVVVKMKASYMVRTPEILIKKLNELDNIETEETIRLIEEKVRVSPSIYVTYLIGLAGTGKTSTINYLVKMFPRVITHKNLGIKQVPILKIDTPHKSSRKDLCKNILEELDACLGPGSDYSKGIERKNENDLTLYVKRKLLLHFVGSIIIDEIQDLKSINNGPTELTVAFLKRLTNQLGVPLVFVGSLVAKDILFKEFQLATRLQGFKWDRFNLKDKHWKKMFEALFKLSVLPGEQELTPELEKAYYILTQGIPRLVVRLHCDVQKICIHENKTTIDTNSLLITAENLFSSTKFPLEGIQNYNTQILGKFQDLMLIEKFVPDEKQSDDEKCEDKYKDNGESEKQSKDSNSNSNDLSSGQNQDRLLLDLFKNCSSGNEMHSALKENNIIRPFSEIVEYNK